MDNPAQKNMAFYDSPAYRESMWEMEWEMDRYAHECNEDMLSALSALFNLLSAGDEESFCNAFPAYMEMTFAMIDHRQSVNPYDEEERDEERLLSAACRLGLSRAALFLIESGAKVFISSEDSPPLLGAASSKAEGARSCIELLLERGSPLEQSNPRGEGALHLAARAGRADLCLLFLEKGLSPSATDARGLTASELASQTGLHDVAACIQSWIEAKVISSASARPSPAKHSPSARL